MPAYRVLRRVSILVAGSALLAGTALVAPATAAGDDTHLRVTVRWAPGVRATWTLTCDPVGGTHPNGRRACRLLDGIADPFAPLPPDIACTMIYGGPETARVVGRWRGAAVDAGFSRVDGCQIARWEGYRALFTDPGTALVRGRVDLGPTCPVERPGQTCELVGAPATVTAVSGTRRRSAASGADGFALRLPRGVWRLTADAGMSCASERVDLRRGTSPPGTVVIACDTGIR